VLTKEAGAFDAMLQTAGIGESRETSARRRASQWRARAAKRETLRSNGWSDQWSRSLQFVTHRPQQHSAFQSCSCGNARSSVSFERTDRNSKSWNLRYAALICCWLMRSDAVRDEDPPQLLTYRIERLILRSEDAQTLLRRHSPVVTG